MFILGLITGVLISLLIVATLTYFRRVVEHNTTIVEKMIESHGPRPKGFVFDPSDDATEARERIIEANRKAGKDTPLKDLL